MGRLRDRCEDDATFLGAMRLALHWSVNGHFDREWTEQQHLQGCQAQLEMLERHARSRPNAEELLEILRTKLPTIDRIRELAAHQFLVEPGGIPPSAPEETWPSYVRGESAVTPGYSFTTEPMWDHDDVAEYSLLRGAEESHRRILLRWLAHEATVRQSPEARAALVKAFTPLVRSICWTYRGAARRELGEQSDACLSEYLAAALGQAIDEFDFFFKRYDPALKVRYPEEFMWDRRRGVVTSELELPIGNYLKKRLTEAARSYLGLERRNPNKVRGPFTIAGGEERYLLIEDAVERLGVSATQVRRRIKKGQLRAWKPAALCTRLGIDREELELTGAGGVVGPRTEAYWIIDAESAQELLNLRRENGTYELGRRGRPRKAARAAASRNPARRRSTVRAGEKSKPRGTARARGNPAGRHPTPSRPPTPEPLPRLPQAVIERDGVQITWPRLDVRWLQGEDEEPPK